MWAIQKDVKIICMSWSISGNSEIPEIKTLIEALTAAKKAKIIMFSSSDDEGAKANLNNDCYPANHDGVICIGGATDMGYTYTGAKEQSIFTFPGGFPSSFTQPPKEVSGSSVATAYAAGFAALIMYCVEVALGMMENAMDGSPLGDIEQKHRERLQEKDRMCEVFDKMMSSGDGAQKVLPLDPALFPDNLGTNWGADGKQKLFLQSVHAMIQYVPTPLPSYPHRALQYIFLFYICGEYLMANSNTFLLLRPNSVH